MRGMTLELHCEQMAIANAIGSNVFNILLGLGGPWMVSGLVFGEPVVVRLIRPPGEILCSSLQPLRFGTLAQHPVATKLAIICRS